MKPLARGVRNLLSGLGIAAEVEAAAALDGWPAAAAAVFGADASSTRALSVDGTTLIVAVPDPSWAGEIRLREADLLARLRVTAPRSGISAIRSVPAR